jgi:hypothetical protein
MTSSKCHGMTRPLVHGGRNVISCAKVQPDRRLLVWAEPQDCLELPVRPVGLVASIPAQGCWVHNCSLSYLRLQGFSALDDTGNSVLAVTTAPRHLSLDTRALKPLPTES